MADGGRAGLEDELELFFGIMVGQGVLKLIWGNRQRGKRESESAYPLRHR